jgi:two-component system response regulator BaeR
MLNGNSIELTALEFNLLSFLMDNPGHIYARQQLMDKIYPDLRIVSDRTIDSHVKKLRRKLAAAAPGLEIIHAIYGVGYRFEILEK